MLELAERLSAPVATTISGKGSIDEHHPLAVGVVGSNGGTPETRAIVDQADLIIFIGCRAGSVTTERWRHPAPGQSKIIHLDVDPAVPGVNYPADAALIGDAKLGLKMLNQALANTKRPLDAARDRSRERTKIRKIPSARRVRRDDRSNRSAWWRSSTRASIRTRSWSPTPARLVPIFPPTIKCAATGRGFISNRAHGALGYSMAAAMGAHFAQPKVKCVSVMGDGSFGFTCGELETAARYRLPITFIVIANASYGWIKAGQKSGYGQRYFAVDFAVTDHAAVAAAFGVKSWRVTEPERSRQSVKRSARHGGTDPGRYRLPAAARSQSAGVGMDCVREGNRHSSTAESFPLFAIA